MENSEIVNRVFGKDSRSYLMGVAMMWIVFFHVYLWCDMSGIETPRWIVLFDKGALGVDVFLLLSAYGLQASLEKNSIGRFYHNRLRRLFPVYLLFLLTLFATFERYCPIGRMVLQCASQIIGLSLFKYPEFFSCGFCFDWFTPAIIVLYAFFPLIAKVARWLVKQGLWYEILVLVILVLVGVWIRENKHFSFGLLALRFPIIYLGASAFIHLKRQDYLPVLKLCVVAACAGLLSGNEEMRNSLLTPPLLIVFALSQLKFPFKHFVCLVGRYSYEVYLAHIFPVAFFIPTKTVTNVFVLLAITIGSTIVIAALFAYVQSKFQSRLRQVH